jgi:hypothetical protein
MKQEFEDYELHLRMFIDAGADTHAKHLYGEPNKPIGYDEYKAEQEKLLLKNQNTDEQVIIKKSKQEKSILEEIKEGLLFDGDGIPQYLNADDYYNGLENPIWVVKHKKPALKPAIHTTIENEKMGFNYDEDGIPEYLNADDRYYGIANPEWLKKHEK